MSIYIPKNDYGRRKKRHTNTIDNASRIPFGGNIIHPYYIYPYFSIIEKKIDELLKELLESEKPCLDSQNGNVLDNLIDGWANYVNEELNCQRVKHNSAIKSLVAIRASSVRNAQDLILLDKERLKEIEKSIQEDEIKFKENIL